jgi:glucose/arabinose dehydrogenase
MLPSVRGLVGLSLAAAIAAGVHALAPRAPAPAAAATAGLVLEDAFPGVTFQRPLLAVQPPDGSPRMFVVEQGGRVWIVDHPAPAPPAVASKRLFLDLAVSRAANEEGLLGFAFHPQYATNRRFFVHYSARYTVDANRRHVVSEILASAADADVADPATERTVLTLPQPYDNHWGGWIGFGPDGKLYVALGDGGSGGDPGNRAQDLGRMHGKILRIDPTSGGGYAVPADNPFVSRAGALPEIFAYGLRNPWRCSFDRGTGALWAGDVGQNAWEEVDLVVAGGNYGWRRREGAHDYLPVASPPPDPLIDPVSEYPHSEGVSVTGGFVYRGAGVPALEGAYLFADFESGRLWSLADPYGAATRTLLVNTTEHIASFAEDRAGEVYLVVFSGRVLALRDPAGPPPPPPPDAGLTPTLSELGLFADLRGLVPAGGADPYSVIAPLWSDGASKERFLLRPAGQPAEWRDVDAFSVPVGTFAVKTFVRDGRRLETRVIRRTEAGFDAASYRWRGDLSDADRVDEPTPIGTGAAAWTIPGPDDCRSCHTDAAGFLLGVNARQIRAAAIARWSREGRLTGAPPPRSVARHARLRGAARLEARARSYLEANCASCHRPDDPTNASLDLRAGTPLADTGMLDALPQHGDMGIVDARILAPGDPDRSTLLARLRATGEGRMPQVGTVLPDRAAIRVLRRWIRRM